MAVTGGRQSDDSAAWMDARQLGESLDSRPPQLPAQHANEPTRRVSTLASSYKVKTVQSSSKFTPRVRTTQAQARRRWTSVDTLGHVLDVKSACRRLSHLRQAGCLAWCSAVHVSLFRLI